MAQKIYKMWQLKRLRGPWYKLSEKEQKNLITQVNEALEEVGGKRVVICDANWTNDQLLAFGVDEFPDIEAVRKYTQLLTGFNWFCYVDAETALGTEWQRE